MHFFLYLKNSITSNALLVHYISFIPPYSLFLYTRIYLNIITCYTIRNLWNSSVFLYSNCFLACGGCVKKKRRVSHSSASKFLRIFFSGAFVENFSRAPHCKKPLHSCSYIFISQFTNFSKNPSTLFLLKIFFFSFEEKYMENLNTQKRGLFFYCETLLTKFTSARDEHDCEGNLLCEENYMRGKKKKK